MATMFMNSENSKTSKPHVLILKLTNKLDLTLFRIGGGKYSPPTSFSPVTSINVKIRPQTFLTFSFNPFDKLCKISSLYLVPVPNY